MSEEIKQEASQVTTEDAFYPTETKVEPVIEAAPTEGDKVELEQTAKPEGEQKAEEGEAKKPEEGEDKGELKQEDLVLSEGSTLSKTEVQELFEKAKELGLNKAQAQAFLDMKDQEVSSFQSKVSDQVEAQRSAWKEATMNDPKIGGQFLMQNVELAKRAIDTYAPPELKEALNATGFGDNKFVLEMFANIGRDIGDQSRVIGSPVTAKPTLSEEEVFYGANT